MCIEMAYRKEKSVGIKKRLMQCISRLSLSIIFLVYSSEQPIPSDLI